MIRFQEEKRLKESTQRLELKRQAQAGMSHAAYTHAYWRLRMRLTDKQCCCQDYYEQAFCHVISHDFALCCAIVAT